MEPRLKSKRDERSGTKRLQNVAKFPRANACHSKMIMCRTSPPRATTANQEARTTGIRPTFRRTAAAVSGGDDGGDWPRPSLCS